MTERGHEMAARPGMTLDEVLARSEVVTIGIDGGGADAMLGWAVIAMDKSKTHSQWLHWWDDFVHLPGAIPP